MPSSIRQRILVGFETQQALQQAQQSLVAKALASTESEVVAPLAEDVPEEGTVKADTLKAAGLGGVMGAIAGAIIMGTAQSIPNQSSIYENATPLFVLAVLGGAAFGGAAGALALFFAGAGREQDTPANYKLIVEASSEDIQTATKLLMAEGGRLL